MSKHWPGLYAIGLTGNIGTGKSTVMRVLEGLGATTIDLDRVVRDLLRRGTPVHDEVVEEFGRAIVGADDEIDRRKLGAIAFADPEALRRLEEITHPAVGPELDRLIRAVREGSSGDQDGRMPVVVIEAIKLVESGLAAVCDTLWVVTAPEEQQLKRLMETRGLGEDEARLRIQAQSPQAKKVAAADVVIENSGSVEDLERQVKAAWERIYVPG